MQDITITTAIREVVEKMLNPAAVAAAAAAARHPVSEFQPLNNNYYYLFRYVHAEY